MLHVRVMASDELAEVLGMMRALWPDLDEQERVDDVIFVIERADGRLGGFLAASVRPWPLRTGGARRASAGKPIDPRWSRDRVTIAEGCASGPVGYVEGWWVAPDLRRRGAGAMLMEAAEAWTGAQGLTELASDVELHDEGSIAAHRALGFDEVERVVCFRKSV